MLNLSCLVGQSTGNVKRRLDIYESGVQERGLDWLFKATRSPEIIQGVSMAREEKKIMNKLKALHRSRLWRHQALRPAIQSTTASSDLYGFNWEKLKKNKTKAKAEKDYFIRTAIF